MRENERKYSNLNIGLADKECTDAGVGIIEVLQGLPGPMETSSCRSRGFFLGSVRVAEGTEGRVEVLGSSVRL